MFCLIHQLAGEPDGEGKSTFGFSTVPVYAGMVEKALTVLMEPPTPTWFAALYSSSQNDVCGREMSRHVDISSHLISLGSGSCSKVIVVMNIRVSVRGSQHSASPPYRRVG